MSLERSLCGRSHRPTESREKSWARWFQVLVYVCIWLSDGSLYRSSWTFNIKSSATAFTKHGAYFGVGYRIVCYWKQQYLQRNKEGKYVQRPRPRLPWAFTCAYTTGYDPMPQPHVPRRGPSTNQPHRHHCNHCQRLHSEIDQRIAFGKSHRDSSHVTAPIANLHLYVVSETHPHTTTFSGSRRGVNRVAMSVGRVTRHGHTGFPDSR